MSSTAVMCGVGGWVPPTVITNDMLAEVLDTSDEWIRTRTGVRQRHIVDTGMSTSDLAVHAATRALASAGYRNVDVVVVATTTPDRSCPATAPSVASRLGLTGAAAFDVSAVCTGFIYALAVGSSLITAGTFGSALVIGADAFSTILDPQDRSTRAIFGDGGGAVVLRSGEHGEPGALLGFDLGSDGTGMDLITVPGGGSEQRSRDCRQCDQRSYFVMDGRPVFSRAVRRIAESTESVMNVLGWTVQDVDKFIFHQANERILNACSDRLGLDEKKVFVNLDEVGNTAGASIPLAMADAAAQGELHPGDRVVLSAFGGGLTWGSTALRWPDIVVEDCVTAAAA